MRRRRRNRATWFPVLPTFFGEQPGVSFYASTYVIPGTSLPGDFANGVDAIPLLPDQTAEQESVGGANTLRDLVEGQDYVLERVVGKVNVSYAQAADSDTIPVSVIVGAGIAVLPTEDDTSTDQPALPVEDYNPLLAQNSAQPWLWRRTWVLSNTLGIGGQTTLGTVGSILGPQANWQNGDGYSGTHVDTKGSRRRVRKEQRLYFCICATPVYSTFGPALNASQIAYCYDLRFIGSMRKASNTSTFK